MTVWRHRNILFIKMSFFPTGPLYVEHLGCDALHPHVLDRWSGWNWWVEPLAVRTRHLFRKDPILPVIKEEVVCIKGLREKCFNPVAWCYTDQSRPAPFRTSPAHVWNLNMACIFFHSSFLSDCSHGDRRDDYHRPLDLRHCNQWICTRR